MGVISEMYLFPAVAYCKSNRVFKQKLQTPTNRISIATVADHYSTFTILLTPSFLILLDTILKKIARIFQLFIVYTSQNKLSSYFLF
jgi:hypothetical protein